MLPAAFTVKDDFPPVDYDQWREQVEGDLKGAPFDKKLVTHTYEGIDLQPIYTSSDQPDENDPLGMPGLSPFVRGARPLGSALSGFELCQEHAHPDLTISNKSILADLEGGVTSLLLRLDFAARQGRDPDESADLAGSDGLMTYRVDDFETLLQGVLLNMAGIRLEAGAAFLPAAATLAALWSRCGVPMKEARGAFNADPIGVLATEGTLPYSMASSNAMLADLAQWTGVNCPQVTSIGVDTSVYHHAGATADQDIAFGVATALEYLRIMVDAGISLDEAAGQILFRMSLGTHHFLAIAKLRAARRVWARVVQACGGTSQSGAMRLHARTGSRVLTHRDPYVNLLRNTVGMFAASVGGAETITSVPFDHVVGLPHDFSRRVARNTVLVLQEESHLHRVIDPAGGSWFLDQLTAELAENAWSVFQQIEQEGGQLAALRSGWVSERIDAAFAPREKDIARRKEGITGVSEFPDASEEQFSHVAPDVCALRSAASLQVKASRGDTGVPGGLTKAESSMAAAIEASEAGATMGQLAHGLGFHSEAITVKPLEARSFAEPYEQLRDASDAWQAEQGARPKVFLANLGPVAHHTARATYSKNFFEAGGFDVQSDEGFSDADAAAAAFAESGAKIVVICSSDKLYPELIPAAAPKLKAVGARTVIVAGAPGDSEAAWREAGVDRFIFMKCDVLATLRDMLREEGVLN